MKRHRHPEFLKSQYVMEESTDQILKISQKNASLTEEEVIKIHSSKDYLISTYLDSCQDFHILEDLMKEFIHQDWRTPESEFRHRKCCRIGGSQTGIYPLDSPGGWQLLGLTPVKPMIQNERIQFFLKLEIISVLYLFPEEEVFKD